ncbi:MAG: hypothetical protein ACOCVG_05490 [Verrucomicrobiota bacterium]
MKSFSVFCCLLISPALFWTTGCGDSAEDVTVYEIPKDPPAPATMPQEPIKRRVIMPNAQPPAATASPNAPERPASAASDSGAMQPMPGMVESAQAVGAPTWEVPEGWQAVDPGSMRKGSFQIPGEPAPAELAVTVFPGDVGGLLANVNRWRSQVGLPPINPPQLAETVEAIEVDGNESQLVLLKGDNGGVLGAIVPDADQTWFFKMSGPVSVLEGEQERFRAFLATVELPQNSAESAY